MMAERSSYHWSFGFSLLFLLICSSTANLTIYISQESGVDNPDCLQGKSSQPCQSLTYTIQNKVIPSNSTSVELTVLDKVYLVTKLLNIQIEPHRVLNLSITGENKSISLRCVDGFDSGMFIVNGPNMSLLFTRVIFQGCQHGKNIKALVMVNNIEKVSFFACHFENNSLSGVFAINSAVHIENCMFKNNSLSDHNMSCGDLCDISSAMGGALGVLVRNETRDISINIFKTKFIGNSVYADNKTYYGTKLAARNVSLRGGAVHVTFAGTRSFQSFINVSECSFQNNKATIGGGLYIEASESSSNNAIEITKTQFSGNIGSQVGGGFMVALVNNASITKLRMIDVNIDHNWSRSGSGIYIFLRSERVITGFSERIVFLFKRVHVFSNIGSIGSGVKIVSPIFGRRAITVTPVFENCDFTNNIHLPLTGGQDGDMASFVLDRVNILFNGTNTFLGNRFFGATFFSNALIVVSGSLKFIGNTGKNGGAMLMQNSQIILQPYTQLLFLNNVAGMLGGAMYIVTSPLYRVAVVGNPECFITYYKQDVTPSQWKANVSFINNTAALKGAAINIDTLIQCAWDMETDRLNFKKSLRWNKTFYYHGNLVKPDVERGKTCHCDISTDVNILKQRGDAVHNKTLKVAPGELLDLDIGGYDELNNSVFTLLGDLALDTSDGKPPKWLQLQQQFFIIEPDGRNQVHVSYTMNENVKPLSKQTQLYFIDVLSSRQPVLPFTLERKDCNLGFKLEHGTCVCDTSIDGIIGCTADGHYVQIKEGYWIGEIAGEFTSMPCPFGYCKCLTFNPSNQTTKLNGCFFHSANHNKSSICANNREGYLCGDCQKDFTVGIRGYNCVNKKAGAVCVWNSVVSVLVTIIVCALIFYFNPGLDNDLRGPLFCFQVLAILFPPATSDEIEKGFYKLVYYLSSLFDFTIPFTGYFSPNCYLFDGLTNEFMLVFGYSSSILALVVFIFVLLLSYKRIVVVRRKNAVQCFWLLLIFMYNSLTKTSFQILRCPSINGKFRLFAQASVVCFERSHLVMAIFAIITILLCGVVIPVLIILTTSGIVKVNPHYLDTLTNNLKPHCQWWWVVELWRRFILVTLAVFVPIWNHTQVFLVLTLVLILTMHCFFLPYQQQRANITETVFLFALCCVALIQLLDVSNEEKINFNMSIVCLMLAYTILVVIYKLSMYIRRRLNPAYNTTQYEDLDEKDLNIDNKDKLDQSVQERRERIDALFAIPNGDQEQSGDYGPAPLRSSASDDTFDGAKTDFNDAS